MNDLLLRIRKETAQAASHQVFLPTSATMVDAAEEALGFAVPDLLRTVLTVVGNGGFGPGYGVIGVEGGHESDFGTLVKTHQQLKADFESEGPKWPPNLLPFCSWGCNIFSCVECDGVDEVYLHDNGDLDAAGYDIVKFFEMWLDGVDLL